MRRYHFVGQITCSSNSGLEAGKANESIFEALDHASDDLDTGAMCDDDFTTMVARLQGKALAKTPPPPPTTQQVFTTIKEVVDGQEISEDSKDPATGNACLDALDAATTARNTPDLAIEEPEEGEILPSRAHTLPFRFLCRHMVEVGVGTSANPSPYGRPGT
jgi:hypothetical protein